MSWGERSCQVFGSCKVVGASIQTCNVDCPSYVWDGKTMPDSVNRIQRREAETPFRCRQDSAHPGGFINRMDDP